MATISVHSSTRASGSLLSLNLLRTFLCGVTVFTAGATLSGCGEFPASAPTAGEVLSSSVNSADGIFVFDLDSKLLRALSSTSQSSFVGRFANRAPAAKLKISIGDTLQVAIFEQTAVGLFTRPSDAGASAGGLGSSPLLPVMVGSNGDINVPYAGVIRAADRTTDDVRAEIERKLADKAVNPQVQVVLSNGSTAGANSATVGGEVSRGGVFPLRASGTRLLDVIAEAGGERFPAYETTVHLNRGQSDVAVSLQRIVDRPAENIFVYPNDNIYITHDPKAYSVLGSSAKVGRFPFPSVNLNLAEAVAESGGFIDQVSDPAGVFVFRYETPGFVRAVKAETAPEPVPEKPTPVIYRVNLREGDGFFYARQFSMRDKDIILLANADVTQLQKFVSLLLGISAVAVNVRALIPTSSSSSIVTTTVAAPQAAQ